MEFSVGQKIRIVNPPHLSGIETTVESVYNHPSGNLYYLKRAIYATGPTRPFWAFELQAAPSEKTPGRLAAIMAVGAGR